MYLEQNSVEVCQNSRNWFRRLKDVRIWPIRGSETQWPRFLAQLVYATTTEFDQTVSMTRARPCWTVA